MNTLVLLLGKGTPITLPLSYPTSALPHLYTCLLSRLEAPLMAGSSFYSSWFPGSRCQGWHSMSFQQIFVERTDEFKKKKKSFMEKVLSQLAQLYLSATLHKIYLVKYIHTGAQSPMCLIFLEIHLQSPTENTVI